MKENLGFYKTEEHVWDYIEMCGGKARKFLIETLKIHLAPNSTVLELGMGPGNELDILKRRYKVTGSDYSQVFLDLYNHKYPDVDLLLLDAVTLKTSRRFDCIYSNKVLHHLTRDELRRSLTKQKHLLKPKGILFHTFWRGKKEEEFQDLRFIQYEINCLQEIIEMEYEIIEMDTYEEMLANDSIYVVLKSR